MYIKLLLYQTILRPHLNLIYPSLTVMSLEFSDFLRQALPLCTGVLGGTAYGSEHLVGLSCSPIFCSLLWVSLCFGCDYSLTLNFNEKNWKENNINLYSNKEGSHCFTAMLHYVFSNSSHQGHFSFCSYTSM